MPRGSFRERFSTFAELEREFAGFEQSWLSPAELERLMRYRDSRRRAASTWGRVLSKRLLLEEWADRRTTPRAITIQSHDENGKGIAPIVLRNGIPQPCHLSISHTDRAVFVAVSFDENTSVGVDLVDLETQDFSEASRRLWFTTNELRQIEQTDSHSAQVFWAVKEAAFKVCRNGEPFAPRQIEITAHTPTAFSACCRFPLETRHCEIAVREHREHMIAVAGERSFKARTPGEHSSSPAAAG